MGLLDNKIVCFGSEKIALEAYKEENKKAYGYELKIKGKPFFMFSHRGFLKFLCETGRCKKIDYKFNEQHGIVTLEVILFDNSRYFSITPKEDIIKHYKATRSSDAFLYTEGVFNIAAFRYTLSQLLKQPEPAAKLRSLIKEENL